MLKALIVAGDDVILALKKKFRVDTDKSLQHRIGVTIPAIQNWKKRTKLTARQIAGLVHKATVAGARNLQKSAIRPLVEFFPCNRSKKGAGYDLFAIDGESGDKHKYFAGLRKEMESHFGVYLFFDSRGQAIYAGKARKQSLWKEMNLAFNRQRGGIQTIKRVRHPRRNQTYRTSDEKSRQIRDRAVPLHELAHYFSAYVVTDGMITEVEAMLVRSFANDLLNKRMERFGQQRRASD
ncbi:MAG TPA: hypothetical protein VGR73_00250 [Bryobacteraceae bacterium]|nr:hypothetical protein [Bryobacteraceae bacterium]